MTVTITMLKKLKINNTKIIAFITALMTAWIATSVTIKLTIDEVHAATAKPVIYGDVNNDGVIDIFDEVAMRQSSIKKETPARSDVNGDGVLNQLDIQQVHQYNLYGTADFNAVLREQFDAIDRTVVTSGQPIETSMTAEMAAKVTALTASETTTLGKARKVYEYLYNTMLTEFYTGSRKGAIGAYEQGGGNDVDLASLLIAMLRYVGCTAQYANDVVAFTEPQLISLTMCNNIEAAAKILKLQGRTAEPATNAGVKYYLSEREYVIATIGGVKYNLDISFKSYEKQNTIYDTLGSKCDFSNDKLSKTTNSAELEKLLKGNTDMALSLTNSEISFTSKKIVQKSFASLPTALPYLDYAEPEIRNSLDENSLVWTSPSKDQWFDGKSAKSDWVSLSFNGKSWFTRKSAELYGKALTVTYEVSADTKELSEYLDFNASSIFTLPVEVLGQQMSVEPVLKLDGVAVLRGNPVTLKSYNHPLYIGVITGGKLSQYSENLQAGEICSVVIDTGQISPNELATAYNTMLKNTESINQKFNLTSETAESKLNETNIYNDKHLGSMLRVTGLMYFSKLDITTRDLAETSGVHSENEVKIGLFGYKPKIDNKGIKKAGQFYVDISKNNVTPVSKTNAPGSLLAFSYARGIQSSALESSVLEEILDVHGISTAELFRMAQEANIPIITLSKDSQYKVSDLSVSATDRANIQAEIDKGNIVITMKSSITSGEWSGIGFISMSQDGGSQIYYVSSGFKGGLADFLVNLCFVLNVSFDILFMIQSVTAMMALLATAATIAAFVIPAVILGLVFMMCMIDIIEQCINVYEYGIYGNVESGAKIMQDTAITSVVTLATLGLGKLGSVAKEAKAASTYGKGTIDALKSAGFSGSEVTSKIKVFEKLGLSKDTIGVLLKDPKCMYLADDVLRAIGKGGGNANNLARLVLLNGDSFSNLVVNYTDDVMRLLTNCGDEGFYLLNMYEGGTKVRNIDIVGNPNSELDEVDFIRKIIYEEKDASGLYISNPTVPQTEAQWAENQIYNKGGNRIKALSQDEFRTLLDKKWYTSISGELKGINDYVFRVNADTPALRIAVEDQVNRLRVLYPKYNFTVIYGYGG